MNFLTDGGHISYNGWRASEVSTNRNKRDLGELTKLASGITACYATRAVVGAKAVAEFHGMGW